MAYVKTEKVLADIQSRKSALVASAIDIITRHGIEALTPDAVVKHAGLSIGLFYKHFPDRAEIVAAVVALILDRDLAAMAIASSEVNPLKALTAGLSVFYSRLSKPRLARAMADQPAYRIGIRSTLERLIRACGDLGKKETTLAAAGALGALFSMADVGGPPKTNSPQAVLFVLRGLGHSESSARRALERI